MIKFVDKLLDFMRFLERTHLDLDKLNSEFMDISDEDLIDTIGMFESFTYDLTPQYYDFFRVSSMSSSWSYTNENNDFIYGGFHFNGILDLFTQDSDFWDMINSINGHTPSDDELRFLKELNWFEKQAWGDDAKYGCFLRRSGDFPPEIYFYDYGAYFPLSLSLEEYFDAMIASCAVRGWQYFYMEFPYHFPDFPKVNKDLVIKDMEFIVKMLPQLFPSTDFSYHRRRLESIK